MKRLSELNTRDCLWVYILRMLSDKPLHAYAIRKEIRERFGFTPGTVTAYKVLYLLRKSGHVEQKRKGRTNVYNITPKGKTELKKASDFYKNLAVLLSGRI